MIAPVGSVFRTYETHAQWVAFDRAQQSRTSPVSRITRAVFPDSTMAGHRFDRFAKQTAADLADIAAKNEQTKQTAETARHSLSAGPEASVKAAKQLAQGYNDVVTALGDAGAMLRSTARKFSSKLPFDQLAELGFERQPDDTIVLNPETFAKRTAERPQETTEALAGFADRLAEASSTMRTMTAAQLLETRNTALRGLGGYTVTPGGRLGSYLPLPMTGTLLDTYM
ncbi:hypothetical protein WMW72_29875 [Paenibacillus filicis]|uniref:Uncharacterized protein n=1 Tax=Paenibacillus filicis TaxID=669464 RepID=A0ABU9DTA9_9BACL